MHDGDPLYYYRRAGSNRTFMELKFCMSGGSLSTSSRSNRTFMELKLRHRRATGRACMF